MKVDTVEADVLCVGGGIAGLMAAIRASELGAKVIVAEKGNTLRSGSGATGNDHFHCYIPEIHGTDIQLLSTGMNMRQARAWFEYTPKIVKMWDSWGIPMKYHGKYEFAGHDYPGSQQPNFWLKYSGRDQKPILTKEAVKRGTEIINRVMVLKLFSGAGGITGALGVDTREDRLIVFRAKAAILGTGTTTRLYPGPTPMWMFNWPFPSTLTGDGRVMAYHAGAEIANPEIPSHHVGAKWYARAGQATWAGVVRDPQGNPVGPFVTSPDKRYGDMIIELNKDIPMDYLRSGKGPVYMDCTGISEEDLEYMVHWLKEEANHALLSHLEEEGIDLRKNPIEFQTYTAWQQGFVNVNAKTETSVKGLYATGDDAGGGISGAAVMGWFAGENAAKYAQGKSVPTDDKSIIEETRSFIEDVRRREVGPNWKEANIALSQIMGDYAGALKSATLLEAGLTYLRRLRDKAHRTMIAGNQHELMRCLEVLNLFDLGELVFVGAVERKETRGLYVRADYPYPNPLTERQLVYKDANGKPATRWA